MNTPTQSNKPAVGEAAHGEYDENTGIGVNMRPSTAHTPTPYFVCYTEDGAPIIHAEHVPDGIIAIAGKRYPQNDGIRSPAEEQANAAFIVRACNSHAALVAFAERFVATYNDESTSSRLDFLPLVKEARAALAQAESPTP